MDATIKSGKIVMRTVKDIQTQLHEYKSIRYMYNYIYYCIAKYHKLNNNYYNALRACCRAKRIVPDVAINSKVDKIYNELFNMNRSNNGRLKGIEENIFLNNFKQSHLCKAIRNQFNEYGIDCTTKLKYFRKNDSPKRQGNLVLLKKFNSLTEEKGVIYLKFNESIEQFCSLYDLGKISKHYRLVIEPSTWGYMEEPFHLLIGSQLDVIVQAQDKDDYDVICNMKSNLLPVRLGAGDWVDTDIFQESSNEQKIYDIVMVASWSKVKRHDVLFKAISSEKLKDLKILLIGYPWDGRTREDIIREAKYYGINDQIEILENISQEEVSNAVKKSKIGIMITKREGANRGIYECLLQGVPVILYSGNRGVNKDIINETTGRLASDDELGAVIKEMLSNYRAYSKVARWARQNTGRKIAHALLNEKLRQMAIEKGESYTKSICEIKTGHEAYVYDSDRIDMEEEYKNLKNYLDK